MARIQPVEFFVTLVLLMLSVASGLLYLQQWQRAAATRQQLFELRQIDTNNSVPRSAPASPIPSRLDLPPLSSARFVDTLNEVAADGQIPLDEVSYELDDNVSQPYLRYRAVLTLSASYPAIRQFVAQLSTRLPNVDLDAISCTRGDIAKAALTCDLSFSAFFSKGANG